jgi:hypothetical protein
MALRAGGQTCKGQGGATALHYACEKGTLRPYGPSWKGGADVNAKSDGYTYHVIRVYTTEIFKALIERECRCKGSFDKTALRLHVSVVHWDYHGSHKQGEQTLMQRAGVGLQLPLCM